MVRLTRSGKESLDALVAKIVEEKKIPGFVFGASTVDEEIYFKGGGYNVVDDPSSGDVNEDSVFWICSQTKLITHIAALQLLEKGSIAVETPMADYLPEFANPVIVHDEMANTISYTFAKNTVRIKHLLNFSSGLFYPMKGMTLDKQLAAYVEPHSKEDPVSEFLSIIKGDLPGIPLKFEPGSDFVYGWSSDILGYVIEKVSGKTLEQYLKENVFGPLGMKSSFYLTPELKAKCVDLTFRRNGKLEPWAGQTKINEQDPSKVTHLFGGVGLHSTLKDYLTLLRHLLRIHAGKATNPILNADTVRELFKPALNEAGAKSLQDFMSSLDPFAPEKGFQWSTAIALCTSDWPGRRKKGTAFWSGWAGQDVQ
ncbi:beta-lactamase/transpeptidase-like protein [Flammula alnicola]|nr:beta-lactamase/transpeptidase-like protein [Flammula alnicola]